MTSVAPFVVFYIGAAVVMATRGRVRTAVLLAIPLVGALNLFAMGESGGLSFVLLDFTLTPVRLDSLSLLFGYLFHLAAFLGIIFSLHLRDTMQHVAGILYAGSAIGVVFAGDLITLFIFWELLAITPAFLILAQRTERAQRVALRFLIIQVLSGVILLAGVMVRYQQTGSLAFDVIGLEGLGAWLIFLAFGIKCAFPLMHNWLTDAYPEATPTGAVFLSAFTTKVAVYTLARGFPGTELLVYIGAVMSMFPIFFAVIENDLRRVLSYSLINQLGFMVVGIGIGTPLAINGAVSHAFVHVIYKSLLFMSMGAVLYRTGTVKGSELGGLVRSMPLTAVFCIVGAASISAFPLFSGFVAKSMIMAAALEEGHPIVWLALLFASAGVFHHAGIKVPFFAFFAHDSGIRCKEAPRNMLIAMGIAAFLCIAIGVYPDPLYAMLPYPVEYQPYTAPHVMTQLQLLFFSALAFCWLKLAGIYPPELPGTIIDAEWIYRKAGPAVVTRLTVLSRAVRINVLARLQRRLERFITQVYRHHGPEGVMARTWTTGGTALWVAVLLGGYLLFYFL